jgi:hypothetical protein
MAKELTEDQIVDLLVAAKGKEPLETFAPRIGVSFQFVAKVIAGKRGPGKKIAAWLGYRKKVIYEKVSK